MDQIKIFKGLESELGDIENRVNEWLRSSKIRIVNIFGNISPQSRSQSDKGMALTSGAFAPSDVVIVIHYQTGP